MFRFLFLGATAAGKSTVLRQIYKECPSVGVLPTYRNRDIRVNETPTAFDAFYSKDLFDIREKEGYFDHVDIINDNKYGFRDECKKTVNIGGSSPFGAYKFINRPGFHIVKIVADRRVIEKRLAERIDSGDNSAYQRLNFLDLELEEIERAPCNSTIMADVNIDVTIKSALAFIVNVISVTY